MLGGIRQIWYALIYSLKKFWTASIIPKYFNFSILSNDSLAKFVLLYYPAFCWRYTA